MLSRIRPLVRPTLATILTVGALCSAAPLPAPTSAPVVAVAPAPPQILLEFRYYSDSARTNLVGVFYEYCDGNTSMWGVQTQYFRVFDYYCPE